MQKFQVIFHYLPSLIIIIIHFENLNSWHNFLFVVFTPQTSSCGPERWVGNNNTFLVFCLTLTAIMQARAVINCLLKVD